MRKLVAIELPWDGVPADYLQQCLRDSISRGEAPVTSHGMLCATQALDYASEPDRALVLTIGRMFIFYAKMVAVYADYGISRDMRLALEFAHSLNKPIVIRRIIQHASLDT